MGTRMHRLRRLLAVAAGASAFVAGSVLAEDAKSPPVLLPLPEIAPPPNLEDADLEPQITITKKESETVEEARVNGILVWIRVTPKHGRPYYLIPTGGGNTFIRRDSLDSALKVPMWVLFTW